MTTMHPSNSEEWKQVPSVPSLLASSLGRIMVAVHVVPAPKGGFRRVGGTPTFGTFRDGRFQWKFRGKNYRIHRLVCEAFNGPCPDGLVCCHKDEDASNNVPTNLEWATQKHNLNAPGFLAYCRSRTGDQNPNIKGRRARLAQPVEQCEPCRSDCPAGDCAGCAFPPPATHCASSTCPQRERCTRALAADDGSDVVDYGVALAGAPSCRMFLDVRGGALQEAVCAS